MRKKIVMYFRKRPLKADPFSGLGHKRSTYHEFFRRGMAEGFDMFLASGESNHEKSLRFRNVLRYNGDFFESHAGILEADAVFDRSGGLSFPPAEIDAKTLNSSGFKRLCNNKNLMENLIGEYMPKSFAIHDQEELFLRLKAFGGDRRIVFKPAQGMQGKGIVISAPDELMDFPFEKDTEYVLQEFIDTSQGIAGITDTHHDLRIVIADGNIVLSHVRTPSPGTLIANVALGGSIREVPVADIPAPVLNAVKKVQDRIDEIFDYPLSSIDTGVHRDGRPFVFEINDGIGFPSETMDASRFIEGALRSLSKRADRP